MPDNWPTNRAKNSNILLYTHKTPLVRRWLASVKIHENYKLPLEKRVHRWNFSRKIHILDNLESLSTSKNYLFHILYLCFCNANCTHFHTFWSSSEAFLHTFWCRDAVCPPGINIFSFEKTTFYLATVPLGELQNIQNDDLKQRFYDMNSIFHFFRKRDFAPLACH